MVEEQIEDVYALAPMQAGMLFHTLYASEHTAYLDQQLFALPGNLDVAAFKQAWQSLIQRHAVLRTSFQWICRWTTGTGETSRLQSSA
jgi:hypothetical protein